LAPSVSHFKNGSDYEVLDFNDIKLFRGSRPTERVEVHAIKQPVNDFVSSDFLSDTIHITQPGTQFKPDFTMTNAGLHIQLPMDPLPVIHELTTKSHSPMALMGDLRFAFLACGVKGKRCLVAICLRKLPHHAFLKYARTSFDGHTVHSLDTLLYRYYSPIPTTSFNPIWISKTLPNATPTSLDNFPNSVKRLNYELWYKASSPVEQVNWSHKPEHGQMPQLDAGAQALHRLGDQVPHTFTASRKRVQHYICGSLPTRGLTHELITFKGAVNIAFGVVDGRLWIQFSAATRPGILNAHAAAAVDYRTLFADFAFPTGKQWRRQDSLIYQAPGTEGTFDADWAKESPYCSAQYVLCKESDEVFSLRMYLAPLEGWMTKMFRNSPLVTKVGREESEVTSER
jgi:hypothetical protein